MRLEKLLEEILPWSIKELDDRKEYLATSLIPKTEVQNWAKRGIEIRRGCSVSRNESVAIVKVTPIKMGNVKSVEFRVPYKKINGHAVHELHSVDIPRIGSVAPQTTDDLLDLIDQIVRKHKMAVLATETVDS
jgi:hypothetical protein